MPTSLENPHVIDADTPSRAPAARSRTTAAVVVMLFVALAVRVALVAATDLPLTDDPADYHRLATNVAAGEGFGETVLAAGGGPTAFRSPLYPFLLGMVYEIFGVDVTAARLLQAVVGVVTVALVGLLAHHLFGRRAGLVALAIAAVYPPLLLAGASLLTESVALPLLLGAVLLALEHRRRGRGLRWALAAGLTTGFAVLARESYLVLVPALAALVWQLRPRWSRAAIAAPLALCAAAAAVVLPWTIRNAVEMDAFIPVTDADGFIWSGVYNDVANDDDARFPASWLPPSGVPAHEALFDDPSLDEDELSRELRSRAVEYAKDHPGYVVEVVARSTMRLFDLSGRDHAHVVGESIGYSHRLSDLGLAGWYLVAPLALVGIALGGLRRAPLALWALPVLFVAVTVIALGTYRYRAPLEPFVVCLAAFGLCTAADRRAARAA